MDDQNSGAGLVPMLPPPAGSHGTPDQLSALYAALAAAQGEFDPIVKNRSVTIDIKDKDTKRKIGQYEFRYADLEEITAKTRPALSKHKLATIQVLGPARHGSGLALFTQLAHADGGMLISELSVTTGHQDIKNMGAQISYLRRYAKSALLDIAADDDLDEQQSAQASEGDEPEPEQRAGQVTRSAAPATNDNDGFYSDEQFEKSLPGWIAAMGNGSPADRVIKIATSKLKLTPEQEKKVRESAPAEKAQ